ncbi:MAG: GatB/YqeY domain-containing protein [Pseudomonadota bacterium]
MTDAAETLKQRIQPDMKVSMKAGAKARLGVIRLMMAAVKQREIDERITLDDDQVIAVLGKMVKQRRESVAQYRAAGREDLAGAEENEIAVIQDFLPQPLSPAEVDTMIKAAVAETGATGLREMGKVMAILKHRMLGRADMAEVSKRIKGLLGSS